jgi:hypothetical protein
MTIAIDDSCPICLEALHGSARETSKAHPDAATADLQHIFHRSCLNEALKRKRSCPICRVPIVIDLRRDFSTFTKEERSLAILQSIERRNDRIFKRLIATGPIKESVRKKAISYAVLKNFSTSIEKISQYVTERRSFFYAHLIKEAITQNRVLMIRNYIHHPSLSIDHTETLLPFLAAENYIDIILEVLERKTFDEPVYSHLLLKGVERQNLELISRVNPRVTDRSKREECLFSAVRYENLPIVQELIRFPLFPRSKRVAIQIASQRGNEEITRTLRSSLSICERLDDYCSVAPWVFCGLFTVASISLPILFALNEKAEMDPESPALMN